VPEGESKRARRALGREAHGGEDVALAVARLLRVARGARREQDAARLERVEERLGGRADEARVERRGDALVGRAGRVDDALERDDPGAELLAQPGGARAALGELGVREAGRDAEADERGQVLGARSEAALLTAAREE